MYSRNWYSSGFMYLLGMSEGLNLIYGESISELVNCLTNGFECTIKAALTSPDKILNFFSIFFKSSLVQNCLKTGIALAKFYDGVLRLHSINSKGYWEFTIESHYYDEGTLYISKGLRK